MKNILITGANSYIGTNVEKWLLKEPDKYNIETLDMKDPNWINFDFSKFDVVFHVAGIAHVSNDKKLDDLYYKVNRDLAIETANKAKKEKVSQFIFMSSMIIYGKDNKIGDFRPIDKENYRPINAYGKSKLEADLAIQSLSDNNFITSVIRTPVVYGPGAKGNFPRLQKLALKLPLLPKIDNKRSMIYIDNLSNFIKYLIEEGKNGVFYPQNSEYVSTYEVMKLTRLAHNKKVRSTKMFNWIIKILAIFIPTFNKIYGDKYYELKGDENNYQVISLEKSISGSIK